MVGAGLEEVLRGVKEEECKILHRVGSISQTVTFLDKPFDRLFLP